MFVCSAVGRRIRGIIVRLIVRFVCLFSGGEKVTGYNSKVNSKVCLFVQRWGEGYGV